jgi:hypothetical protein
MKGIGIRMEKIENETNEIGIETKAKTKIGGKIETKTKSIEDDKIKWDLRR